MDDLIAFLRARIDEDEQVARGGNRGPWEIERWDALGGPAAHVLMPLGDGAQTGLTRSALLGTHDAETMEHIARWDPARALAEVEAKRRILEDYRITASAVTRIEREGSAEPYWQDVGYQKLVAGRDA